VAFGILQAHWRQDEWPKEGEPDLTAVRVAGEHEIDERAAGVGANLVGVVWRVRHQENGTVGVSRNRQVEVGVAGARIVDAAEPETGAISLDGHVLVDYNWCAVSGEGLDDGGGVEGNIVVAKDSVAQGSGEVGEDLGAAVEGVVSGDEGEGAVGDEVAGEKHEVGGDAVDLVDDAFEEVGFSVLIQVDVADLDDAVTVEGRG